MLDSEKRRLLAEALERLGDPRPNARSAMAGAIDTFVRRAGLNWDDVLAAQSDPPPDTDWAPLPDFRGRHGSWRYRTGVMLVVMDGYPRALRAARRPWYATPTAGLCSMRGETRFIAARPTRKSAPTPRRSMATRTLIPLARRYFDGVWDLCPKERQPWPAILTPRG